VLEIALQPDKPNGVVQPGQYTFSPCFTIPNVELGVDKYFGFTAHTGDLADNHDIYSFVVKDLTPSNADLDAVRRLYQQRINDQQKLANHHVEVSTAEFQGDVIARLNQIQAAQNLIETSQLAIGDLVAKALSNQASTLPSAPSAPSPSGIAADPQSAQFNSQIASQIQQMLSLLNTINAKLDRQGQVAGAGASAALDTHAVRSDINRLRDDFKNMGSTIVEKVDPAVSGGLSWTMTILLFVGVTAILVMLFWQYKDRADRPTKKLL